MFFVVLNYNSFGLFIHQKRKSMKCPRIVFVVMVFMKALKDPDPFNDTSDHYFWSNTFILRLYLSPAVKSSHKNLQACVTWMNKLWESQLVSQLTMLVYTGGSTGSLIVQVRNLCSKQEVVCLQKEDTRSELPLKYQQKFRCVWCL